MIHVPFLHLSLLQTYYIRYNKFNRRVLKTPRTHFEPMMIFRVDLNNVMETSERTATLYTTWAWFLYVDRIFLHNQTKKKNEFLYAFFEENSVLFSMLSAVDARFDPCKWQDNFFHLSPSNQPIPLSLLFVAPMC